MNKDSLSFLLLRNKEEQTSLGAKKSVMQSGREQGRGFPPSSPGQEPENRAPHKKLKKIRSMNKLSLTFPWEPPTLVWEEAR